MRSPTGSAPAANHPGSESSATADVLLDPRATAALAQRPVRAAHLRHKPGLSTTAALFDEQDAPVGWVQVFTRAHHDKATNAVRRAHRVGASLQQVELADGLSAVLGPLGSDPRLHRSIRALMTRGGPVGEQIGLSLQRSLVQTPDDLWVVRYNPHRRLLVRVAPEATSEECVAVRLTGEAQRPALRRQRLLAQAGVPVVLPHTSSAGAWSGPDSRWVSVWPWWGQSDLHSTSFSAHERREAAYAAGLALARLHASPARTLRVAGSGQAPAPRTFTTLRELDHDLGTRAWRLQKRASVAPGPATAVVHGDFSADQVLLGGGEIRLIDFDRITRGDPRIDLASFVAAELQAGDARNSGREAAGGHADGIQPTAHYQVSPDLSAKCWDLPLSRSMLEGYASARASTEAVTSVEALAPQIAEALLGRVTEPFRAGSPAWRAEIAQRLDLIERVLEV